jgi:CRISPR-associated endonuclease Csn1
VLGLKGEKNRNDHRHHAVDACVIGITDQGMLQRFSKAAASARERELDRLVEETPEPWPSYRAHVERAIHAIWVSFKPDHGHEGAMHNDTAYALKGEGRVGVHKRVDNKREYIEENLSVIEIAGTRVLPRYGANPDGSPKAYKGYKGDSNYCIEIVRSESGKWEGEVVSTFAAYQAVRAGGVAQLRNPGKSLSGKPLVMRLMQGDVLRMTLQDKTRTLRVATLSANGQVFMVDLHEANVDARNRDKGSGFKYVSKMAGSLKSSQARYVVVSPIGDLRDPGFKG